MKTRTFKYVRLFLIVATLSACNGFEKKPAPTISPIAVKTIRMTPTGNQGDKEYVGIIAAASTVSLSFEVAGNVQQVYVEAGQTVHKGQLLAGLDQASLNQAHEAAAATLNQAKDAYKRLTQLHDNNSLPDIKYVEMQTNLEKAKSAEYIARIALNNARLYAPYDGVIGDKMLEAGMNVLPSQQVMQLLKMNPVKVRISVPENEIAQVKSGQKARLEVDALNNQTYAASVVQKGIVANPISHTYEVQLNIAAADKNLMPGMVCKVYLQTHAAGYHYVLPNQAVQMGDNGQKYVWIVRDGKAARRVVHTAALTDNGVIIADGLTTADEVIVEGWQKIGDGTKVQVK